MGFVLNQVTENFECLGIIDKPKTGVTYKVRNLTTGELESLRALPGNTSRDPEAAERLLREIRVQTRLSHPNILAFHDAFEMDGQLVMTTEYVEGPNLAEVCRTGPMPPQDAIRTILQVLEGLEEAHALGIVHRGITAEHVIVSPGGVVKLGGFGLAKPASDTHLTRVGAVMGDPRYISPEQVTGQAALDGRSDLYSVGVLLYQTLTGRLPFEGANDFEVMAAQVSSAPQSPSAVNPAVWPGLDQTVLQALKKNRDERFASAGAFRAALTSNAETATPAPSRAVEKADPVPSFLPAEATPQRSRTAMVCGLIALVIGMAIVAWAMMR